MEKESNPLVKWVVFLCALLLVIVVLQVAIFFRISKSAPIQSVTQHQGGLPQLVVNNTAPNESPAPVPMTTPQPPLHSHTRPSDTEAALNDARTMFNRMDAMFANAFGHTARYDPFLDFDKEWDMAIRKPTMDMRERGDSYIVQVNLPSPGVSNVEVTLNGRMLTIASSANERNGMSTQSSRFETRMQLPGPVGDPQLAEAIITNGMLRIAIPKGAAGDIRNHQIVRLR